MMLSRDDLTKLARQKPAHIRRNEHALKLLRAEAERSARQRASG